MDMSISSGERQVSCHIHSAVNVNSVQVSGSIDVCVTGNIQCCCVQFTCKCDVAETSDVLIGINLNTLRCSYCTCCNSIELSSSCWICPDCIAIAINGEVLVPSARETGALDALPTMMCPLLSPSRTFSSAAVVVTPSRMFSSAAVEVTAVPPTFNPLAMSSVTPVVINSLEFVVSNFR